MVTNIDTALVFYRDLLGFRSDYIQPITAYFMHVILPQPPSRRRTRTHHRRRSVLVRRCRQAHRIRILRWGGIRSHWVILLHHTPSDILVEYGWAASRWMTRTLAVQEMTSVGSFWGHHDCSTAWGGPPPMLLLDVVRAPLQATRMRRSARRGISLQVGLSVHRQGRRRPAVFLAVSGNRPVRQ